MHVEEWERVQIITKTSNTLKFFQETHKLWIGRALATRSLVNKVEGARHHFRSMVQLHGMPFMCYWATTTRGLECCKNSRDRN